MHQEPGWKLDGKRGVLIAHSAATQPELLNKHSLWHGSGGGTKSFNDPRESRLLFYVLLQLLGEQAGKSKQLWGHMHISHDVVLQILPA